MRLAALHHKAPLVAVALAAILLVAGLATTPQRVRAEAGPPPCSDTHASLAVTLAMQHMPGPASPVPLDATISGCWGAVPGAANVMVTAEPTVGLLVGGAPAVVEVPANGTTTVHLTISSLAAGLQYVKVTASGLDDASPFFGERYGYVGFGNDGSADMYEDGLPIHNYTEWVVPITPISAFALDHEDAPANLTPDFAGVLGRPPDWPSEDPNHPEEQAGGDSTMTAPSGTFKVRSCYTYNDEEYGTSTWAQWNPPARFVGYRVMDWSPSGFPDDVLAEGTTGSDGCFERSVPLHEIDCTPSYSSCWGSNQDIYVEYAYCQGWVCIQPGDCCYSHFGIYSATTPTSWDVPDSYEDSVLDLGGWGPPAAYDEVSRVFAYLNNARQMASLAKDWKAANAKVHVNMPPSGWIAAGTDQALYALPGSCDWVIACSSKLDEDTIYLPDADSRAPDVVTHEYGHFVMDKSWGDLWWPGNPYDKNHQLCKDGESKSIAWTEGWADFFGTGTQYYVKAQGVNRDYHDSLFSLGYAGIHEDKDGVVRPYLDLETGAQHALLLCASMPFGDDVETNVAMALWDLTDSAADGPGGWDSHEVVLEKVFDVLDDDCNSWTYYDYYLGADPGPCSYASHGFDECAFVRTAARQPLPRYIDYNLAPTMTITTQTTYTWYRGDMLIEGTGYDPEACYDYATSQAFISSDSSCDGFISDVWIGDSGTASFHLHYDTRSLDPSTGSRKTPDGANYWSCGQVVDSMSFDWGKSASSFGIDNTPPTGSVKVPPNGPANTPEFGPYEVTWDVFDPMSGLSGTITIEEVVYCIYDTIPGVGSIDDLPVVGDTVGPLLPSCNATPPKGDDDWIDVCSWPVASGVHHKAGFCTRNPTSLGTYCYRVRVRDVAGNLFVSDGLACIKAD